MIESFLIVASQVAVLFALMAVGAALRKLRLLTDSAITGMVNVLIIIVTPCLILDVFQRPFSVQMLQGLGLAFFVSLAWHVFLVVSSTLLVRHRCEDTRCSLVLAATFSNAGFMGIPMEHAILGDLGVFYGIVYVVVFNLFIWSWGVKVMAKSAGQVNLTKMLVNPGTVGIVLALPLFFLSIKLPTIISTPIHMLAELNTPLAMIVIGYYLAGAKLLRVVRMPAVYVTSFLRLIAYPLILLGVMYVFRAQLDRNLMLAICVSASAPVAAMVSMFASKHGRDVDTSVAIVSGTTLLSIITMPLIIAFAMCILH